jgi:hypothetical protein
LRQVGNFLTADERSKLEKQAVFGGWWLNTRVIWCLRNAGLQGNLFGMKTFNGHFDGKVIVLDEPADLQPNTKVKIIAPASRDTSGLATDFAVLSEPAFKKIWDNPLDADYDAL